MIPFEFMKTMDSSELKEAALRFYTINTAKRRQSKLDAADSWCRKNLHGRTYEQAACALPDELRAIREELDWAGLKDADDPAAKYVKTTLYENRHPEATAFLMGWMEQRGILTCPYCNHNSILYDSRRGLNTGQLDHYYPKSSYPVLAASFFNLVPSCYSCNHAKSDKQLEFSPYNAVPHDRIMNFRWWRTDMKELELAGCTEEYRNDIDLLHLDALYTKYQNLAEEIDKKHAIFSDTYIQRLAEEFSLDSEFSLDPDLLKELIFGVRLEPDSFSERPLSKFTYDILKYLK